jgi:hypothetical protein
MCFRGGNYRSKEIFGVIYYPQVIYKIRKVREQFIENLIKTPNACGLNVPLQIKLMLLKGMTRAKWPHQYEDMFLFGLKFYTNAKSKSKRKYSITFSFIFGGKS